MNYAKELRKLMKRNPKTVDTKEASPALSGRWLKEISVERLVVDDNTIKCSPTIKQDSNHLSTQGESVARKLTIPSLELSANITLSSDGKMKMLEENVKMLEDTHLKPHLSSHERGGLLLLVHRMKNELFHLDTPSSLSSPHDLIADIEKLLQCALSPAVSSLEPSGLGVLSSRRRLSVADSHPMKLQERKREAGTSADLPSKKMAVECEEGQVTQHQHRNCSDLVKPSVPASSQQEKCTSHVVGSRSLSLQLSTAQVSSPLSQPQLSSLSQVFSLTAQLQPSQTQISRATSRPPLFLPSSQLLSSHEQATLHTSTSTSTTSLPSKTMSLPSSLLVLLSTSLAPALITAYPSSSTITSMANHHRQKVVDSSSALLPPSLAPQQVLSASSPVCLDQEYKEVLISKVLNPAFTSSS